MPGLFKQKLAADELVRVFAVGRFPSPVMIDMFALAGGFDGFWIDQEHAGLTYEQINHPPKFRYCHRRRP